MKWLLILVSVLVLIGGVLFSGIIQNKLMFHPSTVYSVSDMPDHTEVYFNGLHGLLFKSNPESRKIILHCHGNAGNMSNRGEIYEFLISTGANVFAFDYSGYGKSKGTPSEQQLYRDAESAYQQLKLDYRPEDIIIYGESIGGGVATWLASQRKCGGLVLQSTFAEIADMVSPILHPFCGYFKSIEKINNVKSPVIFSHSKTDEIIPYSSGRRLYQAFQGEKRFYKMRGGHNTPVLDAGYRDVLNWLLFKK